MVSTHNDTGYKITSPAVNNSVWYNVMVKVNYSIIDDPKILTTTREFMAIKTRKSRPTR